MSRKTFSRLTPVLLQKKVYPHFFFFCMRRKSLRVGIGNAGFSRRSAGRVVTPPFFLIGKMASREASLDTLAEEESDEHGSTSRDSSATAVHGGEENTSVVIRKRALTDIFLLPLRVVYGLPRPLRDAITNLKKPFLSGILDLYSQQVCELLESYEAYNDEKLERERRAEKRSLLIHGSPHRTTGSSQDGEEVEEEEEEEQEEDNERDGDDNDGDWKPKRGTRIAAPPKQVIQPTQAGKKRHQSDFSFHDIQFPMTRKRGRPRRDTTTTNDSGVESNKRPKDREYALFGTQHLLRPDAATTIGDQLNILRRQLTASLLVLETIQAQYDDDSAMASNDRD
jgi:hypothetical protein